MQNIWSDVWILLHNYKVLTDEELTQLTTVKVPIIISGSTPYSFQIDEIKVIVNDVERNILKLGSFFTSNGETITIE